MGNMSTWALILKVTGLVLLLSAWGADQFWLSASVDNLKKLEFMTINGSLIDNNSDMQFLKYIMQNRSDPKLLSLSYRNLLQSSATTASLLREEGVKEAKPIFQEGFALLGFVQQAYESGQSLEPRDLEGRSIKSEIVDINTRLQAVTKTWLNKMRRLHRLSGRIFVLMYIAGSIALIGSEIMYHYLPKD